MNNTVRKIRWTTLIALTVSVATIADEGTGSSAVEISANYDLSELIQPPPAAADQQLRDGFASFTEAMANETYSEAEIVAKQMVELVDANATDAGFARARALHNLAIAQQFLGNYESAIQNYSAVLDLYSSADDNLSPELILPLRGLAIAHLDAGQADKAFEIYDRAVHVSNVNYGPHSLKQLPILNSKMQVYLDREDPASALDMLDRIYMLYSRKYPRDSEELLPALYQKAEQYRNLKMYAKEYRAWRHILDIKQKHHAENDLALIEPNIRIAEIHVRDLRRSNYRAVITSNAERYLKRALRIAENSPEDDWQAKKECLLSLADFYTLFGMKGRARRYYSRAWDLLSSNEAYRVARAENFALPVPLARPALDPYANFEYNPNREKIDQEDYLQGEMTLAFTVDDRGRTQDLRIVAADPPNFSEMEKRARNSVEEFIYRPRYVDGMPMATSDQQYRVRYFYVPAEYQAALEKAAKPRSPWQSRKP